MLAPERRRMIAVLIRQHANVRVQDLCTRFSTSASTIRRDLELLEQEGVLRRTYGGAVAVEEERVHGETSLSHREHQLGAAAAALVQDGETVFLGPGACPLAAAHYLVGRPGITVVTNALNVASYLAARAELPVILTGGQVERGEGALIGHVADLALRELRADRALLSVGGIHIPDGVTGQGLPGVQLIRAVIAMVPEVIVIVRSSRWGHVGPAFLAPLDAIDTIVTDRDAPAAMVWDVMQLGIRVVQA